MTELTVERVDEIESVRELVAQLEDAADNSDALDGDSLVLLEMQLEKLHEALSMVVAHKEHVEVHEL
jgi:hypothetical protein